MIMTIMFLLENFKGGGSEMLWLVLTSYKDFRNNSLTYNLWFSRYKVFPNYMVIS